MSVRRRDTWSAPSERYEFNPPPNWPTPPAGWRPTPGWRPEASWPAPPHGWELWVEPRRAKAGSRRGMAAGALALASIGYVGGYAVGGSTADTTTIAAAVPTSGPKAVLPTAAPRATTTVTQRATVTVTRTATRTVAAPTAPRTTAPGTAAPLVGGGDVYYANCTAARAAGAAPIRRGEPGYRSGLDRDRDGIACE